MKGSWSSKYTVFFVVLVVGVAVDQLTKWYASERLATTRPGYVEHSITVSVPEEGEPRGLLEFLEEEFSANTRAEITEIAHSHVRTPSGQWLEPTDTVEPGQELVVLNRSVTVIERYWEFEYTENPGAAFGLLSESNATYRLPFFIVISLLAVVVILYILRGVRDDHLMLVMSLSLIGTGAMGNFIDRIRFGHVVDFIVWQYTEQYRWPTFNVADAFISVGVALMFIEILRGRPEEDDTED